MQGSNRTIHNSLVDMTFVLTKKRNTSKIECVENNGHVNVMWKYMIHDYEMETKLNEQK